jgi:hypothetical protein
VVGTLRAEGRVREALAVAARAAARTGRCDRLATLLEATTPLLAAAEQSARGRALLRAREMSAERALDELVLGADPADVYRTLGSLSGGSHRAALYLIDASCLLAPDRVMTRLTRALARLDVGDPDGALEDAVAIESTSAAGAGFVRASVSALFGGFSYRPALEPVIEPPPDGPSVAPDQPLDAVRHQIQVYATRLSKLRDRVRGIACVDAAVWLPPHLAQLLPNGPVELRNTTAIIEDETDDGVERVEVSIDERVSLDGGVTVLMCRARADWAALCWLCWSTGLAGVGVPEVLRAPAEFTAAVHRAIQRRFRARDGLATGGLVSRKRGVPSFTWEGSDVGAVDPHLLGVAADEYLEIRSVFLWLLWPQNLSPFQSDLRKN